MGRRNGSTAAPSTVMVVGSRSPSCRVGDAQPPVQRLDLQPCVRSPRKTVTSSCTHAARENASIRAAACAPAPEMDTSPSDAPLAPPLDDVPLTPSMPSSVAASSMVMTPLEGDASAIRCATSCSRSLSVFTSRVAALSEWMAR